MIDKIQIQNFQAHKNSELEFDPNVNVIVGLSDTGKSTIMRALKFVVWNRPSGNEFKSYWGGETKVTLDINSNKIIRSKDKKDNYYLNDLNFTAFGRSVPDEINKVMNINTINFESQDSSFYLLKNSAGEVASHFNKVTNLFKIDIASKNIKKWKTKSTNDIEYFKNQIEEDKEKLKKFESLDKFEKDVDEFESLETQITDNETKVNTINTYTNKIKETQDAIEDIQYYIQGETLIDEALTLYKTISENENKVSNLDFYYNQVVDTTEKVKSLKNKIQALEKDFSDKFPDTCPLCGFSVDK